MKYGLYLKRFQYWWPWRRTNQWPFIGRGCDEFHNTSLMIGIPFIGMFVLFQFWGPMRDENSPQCEECQSYVDE